MGDERIYITTPIYYVNAKPHIGHAYTSILCDTVRRFWQLLGFETRFHTGTDEHGEKIMKAAQEQCRPPQEFVDDISAEFRQLLPRILVAPDDFIRTTEPRHKVVAREILLALHARGDLYKARYKGVYCVPCERFYTDKEMDPARPGICPTHETPLTEIEEENYFFRMSKYQDWLRKKIESDPELINPPQFANEVLGILRDPLDDLCITRPKERLPWGIPVPFDENYVVYVWFDALVNYLSALGYPDGDLYKKFWPVANHVIAKDILRPHAVYWPTMLEALGIPLYRRLHVHGYWQSGGRKMSKTLGNVVDPIEMTERYGADAFRYYLVREMTLGSDGDFTEASFVKRFNSDLANDFGNLVSRVAAMIQRYCDGRVPQPAAEEESDSLLLLEFRRAKDGLQRKLERLRLSDVIEDIQQAVRATNRYVDQCAPWELVRAKNQDRLRTVLFTAARATAQAAGLLWPAMPAKCDEALAMFGVDVSGLSPAGRWKGELLKEGARVSADRPLFPRLEAVKAGPAPKASTIAKERPRMEESVPQPKVESKPAPTHGAAKATIAYDDFAKLDLRVATVVEAERVPKADRLLRLIVDLGGEKRQVLAGIAEDFAPEEVLGRQVVMVANLAPRTLRGLESQGMILAARDGKGLKLLALSGPAEPGSPVT